ncbi:MAG: hypothetical protein IAE85_16180 [Anaerolinea sp.]|nr:hypothetical protein [Anaerolinea sp.]
MIDQQLWIRDRFPVLYEGHEAKAVLVDVESFAVMETIMENLLHRDGEPEDAILAASGFLKRLADQAKQRDDITRKELQDLLREIERDLN